MSFRDADRPSDMSLFPIRTEIDADGDAEPRMLRVDSEDASEVLDAIGPETARKLLAAVHEEPGTKSDLAERVDTSIQNVSYHLENLSEAGLVTDVDTWYSSRGREMRVFGPAGGPVVVYAGDEEPSADLRQAISTAVGALAVLGLLSLLVQGVYERLVATASDAAWRARSAATPTPEAGDAAVTAADSGGQAADAPATTEAANVSVDYAAEATTTVAESAGDGGGGALGGVVGWLAGLPPGALFFAGGTVVVLALFAVWYARHR